MLGIVSSLISERFSLSEARALSEAQDEDFSSMIQNPPEVGEVRIHMDPAYLDISYGGITASTFQGVATLITSDRPLEMEGARWHLLSKVFSSAGDIRTDLNRERLLQETTDKDTNCKSFAWKVLRQAKLAVGATTYVGDTALTAPPFSKVSSEGTWP